MHTGKVDEQINTALFEIKRSTSNLKERILHHKKPSLRNSKNAGRPSKLLFKS